MGYDMGTWRFLFLVALAFGSVLPHCRAPAQVAVTVHDAGMGHHQPGKADGPDVCIGCALPVRLALGAAPLPRTALVGDVAVMSTFNAYDTSLELPPPRTQA